MGFNRVTRGAGLVGALGFNSGLIERREIIPLTAAQILGMFATPVNLIAAPGAGKVILVDKILFEVIRTATVFANGGAVSFVYSGGAVTPVTGTVAAAIVNGGAGIVQQQLGPAVLAAGTVVPVNTGVDITNATGAFTAGTGTAKAIISYKIVTL